MGDNTAAALDLQDAGPQQLDTPPYPGTTRIENGQAFDVAGKALGGVDDNGKAVGSAPAPAQKAPIDFDALAKQAGSIGSAPVKSAEVDYDALAKQTGSVGSAPAGKVGPQNRFEAYADASKKIGEYFTAKPMEGESEKGVAHSVHQFLSFPNALYHAFNDPATKQEKMEIEQKMNQLRAGQGMPAASTLPAVPGQLVGIATNTFDKKPPAPTRTQLALHRLVDAPGDELDAKANKELEAARELWDNRHDWNVSVPTGMGVSIPLGTSIALSQSVSGAADKVLSKIPMLGPLINGISEKFEKGDVSGGLSDIALLKAAEHAHAKLTGEPSVPPSKLWSEKGNEFGVAARRVIDNAKEKVTPKPDVSKVANKAKDDFMKAAPPSKTAPYDDNDYEIVRRTAEEAHKADKLQGGEGVSGIETARDIVEDGRQAVENKRAGAVKKFADKPITTNVYEDVASALAEADKVTPGFRDKGMEILENHNLKDATVGEADAIRKKLVADNRAIQKKNSWDVLTARQTDPTFAAREAAIDSLRNGVYGALGEAGVPEAYDWARDEAAHIRVRTAIDRQLFNAEKAVRGSGEGGLIRKGLSKGATTAGIAGGAALGTAVAGPVGAAVGGTIGGGLGAIIGEKIAPTALTRDALMARSFEPEVATPAGPTTPPSQATAVTPEGPELPPPPQPIPPALPPPDHSLHAALATRVGTTVERSNLDSLITKFQTYLENTPVDKLTDNDRDLLQQMNESQGTRRAKFEENVQKAVEQNKAAREKWQKEVQTIKEKHAAEEQSNLDKNKADREADEKIAHSPIMKATAPAMEISGTEGRSSKANHEHEHGHILANVAEGLNPINFLTEHHPDAVEHGAAAAVQTDVSGAAEGAKGLAQRVVGILGGPAFDEVHNGTPINQNTAARSDIARARQILREEGGLSGKDVDKVFDALYERAKGHVSNPEALALVQANIPLREEGLHVNYHMSPGRLAEYVKKLKGVYGDGETPTTAGVREGASDSGLPEGKSDDTGAAGKEQDGTAERVSSKEARKTDGAGGKKREQAKLDKAAAGLQERSTGEAADDAAIKEGGGVPGGRMTLDENTHVRMFHDPKTGTTLGFSAKEPVTAEAVKAKLAESRKAYGLEQSNITTGDKLVDKFGTTKDPLDAAFILSDGKSVPLKTQQHSEMLQSVGYDPFDFSDKARVQFVQGEGAVRVRHRPNGRGGPEVSFSVPTKGVNEEQIAQMKKAAQNLGRGTIIIETAGDNPKSITNPNPGFSTANDIEPMLREIGAHPEGQNPQIAAHEAQGGSTFTPEGENLAGKDTHAVGSYPERTLQVDKLTPEVLEKFKKDNADVLSKGDHAVGTWKDPDTGKAVLDISKTIANRDEAIAAGKAANQKAIYHLGGEGEIPTGGTGEGPLSLEQSNIDASPEWKKKVAETPWETDNQPWKQFPTGYREMLLKDADGKEIGALKYSGDEGDLYSRIRTSRLDPSHQNQGIAKEMYKSAIEDARSRGIKEFRSDTTVSNAARNVWQSLAREGYPVHQAYTNNFNANGAGGVEYSIPLQGQKITDADFKPVNNVDLEQSNIAKSPKGSSVPLMDNPLPVKGTMEGDEVGTLDVTKALNKFSRKSNPALEPGSEPKEMVARAKKIAEDEAKYQLAQSKTGTEWYTTEMKDHDKVLQELRPELAQGETTEGTDGHPVNLTLFKAAEAILSSGQKPYANVKSALRAWDLYKETGQFPPINPETGKSWGPRGAAGYGNAFEAVNKLIADKGEKGAADWLIGEHPVSELREYGENVSGKKEDMKAGAAILGEKRGPFMQNLHGIESKFTADMWVSRTWNRWMGTLDLDPRIEDKGKMTSESDSPRNNTERSLMKESFEKTAGKLGLSTSSLQAVLWYYEQALYRAHGLPVESWSFKDAASRVAKEASAPPEAEQTGFNFGANAKEQGGFSGLGKPKAAGGVHAFDVINALKKK